MGLFDLYGNKIKVPNYKTCFSIFNSFSVIGDSFSAQGEYQGTSWCRILEKLSGVTAYNFSNGGLSTKTWLENHNYGLDKMLNSPATNLYIIALGINDGNAHMNIGTINDIESDNIDSFYSYYGRIIRAVQSHAPNAIIMLSTLARWNDDYNQYSIAIRNIGTYYDIGVLDLAKSEIEAEKNKAREDLRSEVVALAVAGAEKIINEKIDLSKDEAMLKKIMDSL